MSDFQMGDARKANVLVIYGSTTLFTNAVRDHLDSFGDHLPCNVFYEPLEGRGSPLYSLRPELFDAIIIHYSASLHHYSYLRYSSAFRRIVDAEVPVVVFTHDDYDLTNKIIEGFRQLRPRLVFTIIPDEGIDAVYPGSEFPETKFVNCLTGYVPARLEQWEMPPLSTREVHVGYRGRAMPIWYGQLGREKVEIAKRMREHCDRRQVPCDIEWETGKRIYGEGWDVFLGRCRTMLGTESGCNVFEFDGSIRGSVIKARRKNANLTDDEAYELYVKEHEGTVAKTNQISPKVFEAAAKGTVMVLLEGEYSGIIEPDVHYISLKKDYSNVDEVLDRVGDTSYLEEMSARAHEHLIGSKQFTYKAFMGEVWNELRDLFPDGAKTSSLSIVQEAVVEVKWRRRWTKLTEIFRKVGWGVRTVVPYAKQWGLKACIRKVIFMIRSKIF